MLFKILNQEEHDKFVKWALENYKPFTNIDGAWHPVIQEMCVQINKDESGYQKAMDGETFLCQHGLKDCAACDE